MAHKYIETAKKPENHNIILPGTIIKVWIRIIREIIPIQDQGCQPISKSIDNMDHVIIINLYRTIQNQFFQVLATVRNKAACLPS